METLTGNPRVGYRMATADDIEAVTGQKSPYTCRAYAFFYDGVPVALGGYKLENGNFVVFSDIKEGVDAPKMTVFRCVLKVMEMVRAKGLSMYAVAENPELCEKIGFKRFAGDVFKMEGVN